MVQIQKQGQKVIVNINEKKNTVKRKRRAKRTKRDGNKIGVSQISNNPYPFVPPIVITPFGNNPQYQSNPQPTNPLMRDITLDSIRTGGGLMTSREVPREIMATAGAYSTENPLLSESAIMRARRLERFESDTEVLQILGCNHIFNPTSLQRWFQSNVRCPICRYDIRDYVPINNRRRRYNFEDEEETKEETPPAYSSESSDSTLHTSSPEPRARNSVPEPTDNTEFISNLTSVTENMLSDLFSSSFPNTRFNFNGTTYNVDVSNNEIVFQGYIQPNNDDEV